MAFAEDLADQRQGCGVRDIEQRNGAGERPALIEVWNKIDRLEPAARSQLENLAERRPPD